MSFKRIKAPKYMTVDERLGNWANQFKQKIMGFVYCPACGKTILHDNNIIQKHMRNHLKDRLKNREKKWTFHPGAKPTFSDNAYTLAKEKKVKEWH